MAVGVAAIDSSGFFLLGEKSRKKGTWSFSTFPLRFSTVYFLGQRSLVAQTINRTPLVAND